MRSRSHPRTCGTARLAESTNISAKNGAFRIGFFWRAERTRAASAGRSSGACLRHSRIVRSHCGPRPLANVPGGGGRLLRGSALSSNGGRPATISYRTTPRA